MRRTFARAVLFGGAALLLGEACLSPTYVRMTLFTNTVCAEAAGPDGTSLVDAVVYVASDPTRLDQNEAAGTYVAKVDCRDIPALRQANSSERALVLTPGASDVGYIRVVAGTQTRNATSSTRTAAPTCKPNAGDACIRATRKFKYVKHASITLPIVIDAACAGVRCPSDFTCDNGNCVSADCDRGQVECGPGRVPKYGAGTSSSSGGEDAGPVIDSSVDAEVDAYVDPGPVLYVCKFGQAVGFSMTCFIGTQCYDAQEKNIACSGPDSKCVAPLYAPCCSTNAGTGERNACCLAKDSLHPIYVAGIGPVKRQEVCDPRTPCFDDSKCKCIYDSRLAGQTGWGYCQ